MLQSEWVPKCQSRAASDLISSAESSTDRLTPVALGKRVTRQRSPSLLLAYQLYFFAHRNELCMFGKQDQQVTQ